MNRNKKGQFVKTTGNTRYRKVQYKGTVMGEHCREMCKKIGIDKIPNGYVVHHIDGDKKNNNIKNLQLLTHKEHNKIHAKDREVWNKGVTIETNEKWKKTIEKIHIKRNKTLFPRLKQSYNLQREGKTLKEIADICKISTRQVSERLRRYKEITQ